MSEPTPQDLSNDALLQRAPRVNVGDNRLPAVGGIPLLCKIGEGGGGAVYRALHPELKREVAVKVLACTCGGKSERAQRLLAEAQAAAAVKSPRVCELLDSGMEANLFYAVMEYVPGKSAQAHLAHLKERLRPGMTEATALDLYIAIVEGLSAAHALNIVHRDLRPSCMLIPIAHGEILDFGNAKLADLGLAFNEASGRLLSVSAAETGTPGYMSPEQALGSQATGTASDVFSLGAALYTLLVGQPPFGGMSLADVLSATVVQEAGDIRTWRPDVTRATGKVIEICLHKSPSARFADAGALLQALQLARGRLNEPLEGQLAAIADIEALVQAVDVKAQVLDKVLASGARHPAQAAKTEVEPVELPGEAAPAEAGIEETLSPREDLIADLLKATEAATSPADAQRVARSQARIRAISPPARPPEAPSGAVNEALLETVDEAAAARQSDVMAALPAVPAPPPENAEQEKTLLYAAGIVPQTPPAQEWEDPTQQEEMEEEVEPRRRSRALPLLAVAAVLLCVVGVVAWQMLWVLPKPSPMARNSSEQNSPPAEASVPVSSGPNTPAPADPKAAPPQNPDAAPKTDPAPAQPGQVEEDKRLAEAAAKTAREAGEKRQAEEKAKIERERLAAEAKAKAENEAEAKRAADARARVEQERLAAEARASLAREEEKRTAAKAAAEREARMERERSAAEARAKSEREADEKRTAEAKAADEKHAAEVKAAYEKRTESSAKPEPGSEPRASASETAPLQSRLGSFAPMPLPREVTLDLGGGASMEFVLVPAGEFLQGSERETLGGLARKAGATLNDYLDEMPAHKADVASFYIARAPVTVAQFRRFASETGHGTAAERKGEGYILRDNAWQRTPGACWSKPGFRQGEDHPVVMVSHGDCEKFAAWAARQSGRALRLPSETEWEYAARGSQNYIYPWGNKWDGKLANHSDKRLREFCTPDWNYSQSDDGYAFTSPAGAFRNKSWCGALDMCGNVFQWCSDVYEPYGKVSDGPQIILDPADVAPNAKRVLRGGSFLFRPIDCRSSARRQLSGKAWSIELGMRLAFSVEK